MSPAPKDTPPVSPGIAEGDGDGEDDEQLESGDIVEVIDLDELEGDMDEDDEEINETEGAAGGADAEDEILPEENSELFFNKHDGKSVFSCALLEKNGKLLAASGGEDDKAFLWDANTGEVLLDSGTHFKDSVVNVEFSNDGSFLAAADMSGVIKVWKLNGEVSKDKEFIWEFETSDISCMFWHPAANVLFAGTVESELWMWKIPSGESKIFSGHGEKVESAKLLPDGKRALVCYGDGTMRLFDLKTGDLVQNFTGNAAHQGAVTSVTLRHDNVVMASGGVDGYAKISSLANGKNLTSLLCSSSPASKSSTDEEDSEETPKTAVEDLLFSPIDANLLITGSLDGYLIVWDVSSHVSRFKERLGSGVVKMAWRKGSQSEVFVATLDGLVRMFDIKLGKIVADCSGHRASVLDFAQSSDGNLVITASDDGDCRIFDMRKILSVSSPAK